MIYLLIFSIATICAVLLLWYFDPIEGFQTAPTQTTIQTNFWNTVQKVNSKDQPTISALAKVSDADPNDPNDLMPLSFSKYISIYAMAENPNDLSGARLALFNNYNNLQSRLSTNIYDQSIKTAWSDAKGQTCRKLDLLYGAYMMQYIPIISSTQDLSGTAITAGSMKDENMSYQLANLAKCQGTPLSSACISLASQEGPIFSLLAKYDNVNNRIVSSGDNDLSNNLQTVADTYKVLGCGNTPNMFFATSATSTPYYISNASISSGTFTPKVGYTKYPVSSCASLCNNTVIAANCANPIIAPQSFFDKLPLATVGTSSICPTISNTKTPSFSDTETSTIDTTTLTTKLNQLSPYYLSPDTLQYITSSIISGSDTKSSLMTDSDKLMDISNVINNIKVITGTT